MGDHREEVVMDGGNIWIDGKELHTKEDSHGCAYRGGVHMERPYRVYNIHNHKEDIIWGWYKHRIIWLLWLRRWFQRQNLDIKQDKLLRDAAVQIPRNTNLSRLAFLSEFLSSRISEGQIPPYACTILTQNSKWNSKEVDPKMLEKFRC